jgi:hypothetical protein
MRLRTLIAAGAIALMVAATAGCSGNDNNSNNAGNTGGNNKSTGSPSATGGNNSGQAALPDCPTAAAISSALKITYIDPITTGGAKERNCSYASGSVETGNASLHFEILAAPTDFAAIKIGYSAGRTVTDISGLGEEAFSSVLSAGAAPTNTVAARKGTLAIVLMSYASVDNEKAFIATLLG